MITEESIKEYVSRRSELFQECFKHFIQLDGIGRDTVENTVLKELRKFLAQAGYPLLPTPNWLVPILKDRELEELMLVAEEGAKREERKFSRRLLKLVFGDLLYKLTDLVLETTDTASMSKEEREEVGSALVVACLYLNV